MKNTKKNKNQNSFSKPFFFDLRTQQGWDYMKTKAPAEMYIAMLQQILTCPCCNPNEKETARKHLAAILQ